MRMSHRNVEIVSRLNAAFNRGDVDEGMQFFAPDAELRDLVSAPDQAGVVKGIDAIREVWLLWAAEFDDFRAEAERWTDAGDAVIGEVHWQGRGKASGVSIGGRRFDLYELRDGKIVRAILGFESMDEALEAGPRRDG